MSNFTSIVNDDKKIMIHAVCRNGTNRLDNVACNIPEWNGISLCDIQQQQYNEFTHVKIIRDPYQRWRSWFYDFEAHDDIAPDWTNKWNLAYARSWVEHFQYRMHYDTHTGLQKMLYEDPYCNNNVMYLQMEDIDQFLGISNSRYNSSTRKIHESRLAANVVSYLQHKIPYLYTADYAWIKTLDFWQNNS
jgi:hypothetical protein